MVLALFVLRGFTRGFLREVFGVLGLGVGIYLALSRYELLYPYLTFLENPTVKRIVASVALFILGYVTFALLGMIVARLTHALVLGMLDRILGGALGFVEAAVILGLILHLLSGFPEVARLIESGPVSRFLLAFFHQLLALYPGTIPQLPGGSSA